MSLGFIAVTIQQFLRRYIVHCTSVWFGAFALPLVLASISRPFGWWDYLTSNNLFHFGSPAIWGNIVPHYFAHLLEGRFLFRPTVVLFYDLQMSSLGGEFWAWYLIKWGARFLAAGLIVKFLTPPSIPQT